MIAEYVALASARKFPRSLALSFVVSLSKNPDIETVWIDKAIDYATVDLLVARQDKNYSLCDAVSFVLIWN